MEQNFRRRDYKKFDYLRGKFEEHGLGKKLYDELKTEKDNLVKTINIVFVGQARQGKSSLINAFVGKRVANVGASGVCTKDIRWFLHPQNEKIKIWDVPGVDAVNFTRENYLEKIGHCENSYDFFVIVTSNIFSSDAKFIADLVQGEGKRFYLVRTHIDESVRNEMEDHPNTKEEDVIAQVRHNVQQELEIFALDTSRFKVYIVNNRNTQMFDFPQLQSDICGDLFSEVKQEALLRKITSFSVEFIHKKFGEFRNRMESVLSTCAVGSQNLTPGYKFQPDFNLVVEEVLRYIVSFGLTKESLASLEELSQVASGRIENVLTPKLRSKYPILHFLREKSSLLFLSSKSIKVISERVLTENSSDIRAYIVAMFDDCGFNGYFKFTMVNWFTPFITKDVTKYHLENLLEYLRDVALFVITHRTEA